MSKVFAGSDGSFMSAWQAWKRRNHEYESFVMGQGKKRLWINCSFPIEEV